MPKRVLIVAYGFPPSNQVAVHRILRLSKWLPKFGWEPTILTVKPKFAHPYFYKNEDSDLSDLVPDHLEVHRASSFEHIKHPFWGKVQARIMRTLALPDPYVTWVPGAVRTGKKLIDERKIDVVLTTISPHSTALIGYFLRKRTSAKWVIDYRDPWCLNPFNQLGRTRYLMERKIENSMLFQSDFNITTSSLITATYQDHYPKIANNFATITNCYDQELQFVSERTDARARDSSKFRIVHAGSFYPKRNPTSFLASLFSLVDEHAEIRNEIEVLFIGAISDEFRDEISTVAQKTSIDCQMIGAVSYKRSMQYLVESDLLLAINGIEDRDNIFIPGKMFDYIAANKPVLFLGQKGPASEIVEKGCLGAVCAHDDTSGISGEIYRVYDRWKRGLPFKPDTTHIDRFHASNVANQLAGVLDSVVGSGANVD